MLDMQSFESEFLLDSGEALTLVEEPLASLAQAGGAFRGGS